MVWIILAAGAGLLAILFYGLVSMVRPNRTPAQTQKLMRYRVLAQAGVLLLLIIAAAVAA